MKKEYLTVNDISKHYQTTTRNVRRIINNMKDDSNDLLLRKDNNEWSIHQLLLPRFKPQRLRKCKYYSLTIIPSERHTLNEINTMMQFVYDNSNDENLEINYTVEVSKILEYRNHNHIHCYIKCKRKRELLSIIKQTFYELNYKQTEIYDLEGWKKYITKESNQIITINK